MQLITKMGSPEVSEARGGGYRAWLARWWRGDSKRWPAEEVKRAIARERVRGETKASMSISGVQ